METGTFWSAGQRCGHSLHEISYRACFKPALAAYFIEQFSKPGEVVFDPFMGRGTTPLEAALRGRIAAGADGNPLGEMLASPRLDPPSIDAITDWLERFDWDAPSSRPRNFSPFSTLIPLGKSASSAPHSSAISAAKNQPANHTNPRE